MRPRFVPYNFRYFPLRRKNPTKMLQGVKELLQPFLIDHLARNLEATQFKYNFKIVFVQYFIFIHRGGAPQVGTRGCDYT